MPGLDFLYQDIVPTIYYDELLSGKEYFFGVKNFTDAREVRPSGSPSSYIVLDVVAQEDYPEFQMAKGQSCELHLGLISFRSQWIRKKIKLEPDKKYWGSIKFHRVGAVFRITELIVNQIGK